LGEFHQLPPEWILPGNGAAELLTWACRDLAALEATYWIPPAFGDYGRALRAFAAQVEALPLALVRLLEQPVGAATDLVSVLSRWPPASRNCGLLINNPHNPTGALFERQSLQSCLGQFGLVVIDEAFMDFLPPGTEQSLLEAVRTHPNLVILRSLTKFYSLPGLRLGYAIAHPERLQRWQQWRDPWPVNALAVAAAEAVLADIAFQQQTWEWLPRARSQLGQGLTKLPGLRPYPGAANFLLVSTEQPGSEVQARLLRDHRILVRDCLSFPELGEQAFRVAVRTPEENQRLLDGLAAIL